MNYTNVFQLVSSEFPKAGVPFLLIGGFAVNYYKASRSTLDIDFLIAEEDYGKILSPLKLAGYQEVRKDSLFAKLSHKEPFFMKMDVLFTDRETLTEMLKDAKEAEIRGAKFKVPSLKHLFAMKLHALKQSGGSRDYKDLLDIMELAQKNQVNLKGDEFRELCLKFGTPELHQKIIDLQSP